MPMPESWCKGRPRHRRSAGRVRSAKAQAVGQGTGGRSGECGRPGGCEITKIADFAPGTPVVCLRSRRTRRTRVRKLPKRPFPHLLPFRTESVIAGYLFRIAYLFISSCNIVELCEGTFLEKSSLMVKNGNRQINPPFPGAKMRNLSNPHFVEAV